MTTVPFTSSRKGPALKAPRRLTFWIGGFMSSGLTLEWDGTRLRRRPREARWSEPLDPETWEDLPTPNQAAWRDLAQELEEVGAWTWPTDSNDLEIMDGTQWSLKIRWGGRRWSGGGSNAYPPGFERIQLLLERLASEDATPSP